MASQSDPVHREHNLLTELVVVLIFLFCFSAAKGAKGDEILFGMDTNIDYLVTIDPASGATQLVGRTGFAAAPSIAFRSDGKLFSMDAATRQFLDIDPSTGKGTPLWSLPNRFITGLAFDSNDILYATDTDLDELLIIDPEIGVQSVIGSVLNIEDLTISSDGSVLYGIQSAHPVDRLVEIDLLSANATTLLEFDTNVVGGIAFSNNGLLIAELENDDLLRFDLASQTLSKLGNLGTPAVTAMAFQTVPEPSNLSILFYSIVAFMSSRRRRCRN